MMISKKVFKKIITNIKLQYERVVQFNDALDKICDGFPVFDSKNLYLESLLELLNLIFKDKNDYIGWWLWEDVEKIVYYSNGDSVKLDSADDLYDFLIENMKESK